MPITKGIDPLYIVAIDTFLAIPLNTNRISPTGGVSAPIFMTRTTSTANHNGFSPRETAIGCKIGTPIDSSGMTSIMQPSTKNMNNTTAAKTSGDRPMPTNRYDADSLLP
jgi:hypothetical protein